MSSGKQFEQYHRDIQITDQNARKVYIVLEKTVVYTRSAEKYAGAQMLAIFISRIRVKHTMHV